MSQMEKLLRQAERNKAVYPPGTRIEMISMDDSFAPIPAGTRGTVDYVDDMCQLQMSWDNGRTLAVIPEIDTIRKLTVQELEAEAGKNTSLDSKIKNASTRVSEQSEFNVNKKQVEQEK